MRDMKTAALLLGAMVPVAMGAALAAASAPGAAHAQEQTDPATVAEANYQPWMNVFRRYATENEDALFAFYTDVIGFPRLETYGAVHRFQAGAQEFKMTGRVPDRTYVEGAVEDATGVRLFSIFYPDETTVLERFAAAGLPAPQFVPVPDSTRSVARVQDPDGQWLELVAAPGEGEEAWRRLEIGLVVSDLEASTGFYRDFVGLTEIAPETDPISGVTKHRLEHGATIVSLRPAGADTPPDTGSGGIQYVISDAELIDRLARTRGVKIDQPISGVAGYSLRTIWLDDPDGITNYFAQVGAQPPSADR